MALFRKFFYRKPPDGLLEISEKVYVFDCCFTTDVLEDVEYKVYMRGIIAQLRDHFPNASFMAFNFREGERQSQLSNVLSEHDVTVMDYPRHYEGCPLITMEMIHHYLRSSENWLSLGQQNLLLMHCERGGWPVLAFMLAALLIYRKQYTGEQKTLDMIYKQAPRELLHLLSPLNPLPSQLRYLHYVSRRNVGPDWPPLDRALTLDCIILRILPNFDGEGGCRPIFRIYGQDPFIATDRTPKVLYSSPKTHKTARLYKQADCELVKIDIHCHIQGDVVLECISLDEDMEHEVMMFRVMFNTAFIRSNILMLNRDEIDILWDAKDHFAKDFRAEVLFSEMDAADSLITMELPACEEKEGLPIEAFAKVQEIFSSVDWLDPKADAALNVLQQIQTSTILQDKLDTGLIQNAETGILLPEIISDKLQKKLKSSLDDIKSSLSMSPDRQSIPSIKTSQDWHSTKKKIEPQLSVPPEELQIALQLSTQSKIISQRMSESSLSSPVSCSSSLQGSPVSMSRYNSAPSALGITALLQDHAACKTAESFKTAESSPVPLSPPSPDVSSIPNILSSQVDFKQPPTPSQAPVRPPPPPPASQKEMSPQSPPQAHRISPLPTQTPLPLPLPSQAAAAQSLMLEASFTSPTTVTSSLPPPPPPHISTKPGSGQSSKAPPPPPPPPPPPAAPYSDTSVKYSPPTPPPPPRSSTASSVPPPPPRSSTASSVPPPRSSTASSVPPPRSSTASSVPPPPPRSSTASSAPPPPPPPLQRSPVSARPPPPPPPPLGSGPSSRPTTAASAPPPPPALPATSAPSPPPPPPAASAPPPPPPPPAASAPPPPPPPPAASAPPPPPPPALASKFPSQVSQNSSNAPPVPPPPKPGGRPSAGPPTPAPPGVPFGAKGRSIARNGSSKNQQSSSKKASLKPLHWLKLTRAMQGSLWAETQKPEEASKAPEFDMSELESLFSAAVPTSDRGSSGEKSNRRASLGNKPDKVQLIDLRRAYNCEIMLTKVKMPLPDLMSTVLALDDSALDVDQVDNLIKFCPTKEEMELLKGYSGNKENLGKCEQFFLELMKVPRVESKLRVFSFKIQFRSQVSDLRKNLNVVNSAAEQIRNSAKLKRIMQTILSLGNALNQGTARGSAIGFRLDSLLKLTDTRARNNKMTLMHYLCKVLADKLPELLDFQKDLVSLEAASKIQLKYLAEEMQAISKGLEKVEQELSGSENDGVISQNFCKTLKEFLVDAEGEVRSLASLYSGVGRNADALALYFGEDPARCPFEQVVSTLLNFVRTFARAHDENCKQLELEKKRAQKEAENEKSKLNATQKMSERPTLAALRNVNKQ